MCDGVYPSGRIDVVDRGVDWFLFPASAAVCVRERLREFDSFRRISGGEVEWLEGNGAGGVRACGV